MQAALHARARRRMKMLIALVAVVLAGISFSAQGATAAAAIKVAAVGDSITWGAGASNQSTNSYPAQLQTLLGSSYQIGNYGHSGATMLKQGDTPYWNTPQFIGSQNFKPSVVVIMLGRTTPSPGTGSTGAPSSATTTR
jgi:lysophospholipase L1-like esterase